MRTLHAYAAAGVPARHCIIMLPGALQQPEEFIAAGFADAVHARALPVDLVLADLGIGYIGAATDGSMLALIDSALVQPARQLGYTGIWLGGISIGGLIAVAYADRFPEQVDGLCLLSPYPGNRMLLREIEAAGGLDYWQPGSDDIADAERCLWRTLQRRGAQPRIHLGYGRQDRFAAGLDMMAARCGQHDVDAIAGGHDWPTWHALWISFLDRIRFATGPHNMEDAA